MAKSRRKAPTLREQIASLLLTLVRQDDSGRLVPCISRDEARHLSADEIISRFEVHHVFPVALGGDNRPMNLQFKLKDEHRQRTANVDVPAIAKVKRGLARRAGKKRPKRRMQYTALKATHKRTLSGKTVTR